MIPVCLSIAGADPSAGAGIQADLKTFASLGCYGATVITALTVQNTQGVQSIHGIDPELVREQLLAVMEDMPVKAIKIGMLSNSETIEAIAPILTKADVPIVLDPVLSSSSGATFLSENGVKQLINHLLPISTLVTPNVKEACQITQTPFGKDISMEFLARGLKGLGAKASLITGGDMQGSKKNDWFFILNDKGACYEEKLEQPTINTKNSHGTGCTLSSAITALLAQGEPLHSAVKQANGYVHQCLRQSRDFFTGKGKGGMNHFHAWMNHKTDNN